MERLLQLSAGLNLQIVNATTPANFYHVLRRQMVRDFRKLLIAFTPKKLLRFPACVSSVEEFTEGSFQEVIDDPKDKNPAEVDTIMFTSGKMYYEILDQQKNYTEIDNIALVRLEQISLPPQGHARRKYRSCPAVFSVCPANPEPRPAPTHPRPR